MEQTASNNKLLDQSRQILTQALIFSVGLSAMVVAGWYLIEGMLHFAGDDASKRVFIAAGIIFQITESICFIAAAAYTSKTLYWRLALFGLGCILFLFSITVMTLAQKATLQAGEHAANAIEQQVSALDSQVQSLNEMIAGYRLNAEKQSKSIYANSRELGQDSLNRATELEIKKLELTDKLFALNNARRQTSSDFFKQLEQILGYPALEMEFYFLVSRSLLLELCGIMLMAFAAQLSQSWQHHRTERAKAPAGGTHGLFRALGSRKTGPITRQQAATPGKQARPAPEEVEPPQEHSLVNGHWASSHIRQLKQVTSADNE